MHVRAAIFDMDGTLIDSERVIMAAWMSASREAGIPLNASQYSRVIGLNDEESNELLISLLGGEAEFLAVRSAARQKLQEASFEFRVGGSQNRPESGTVI
jgi:beta-phosphoglucomutase-like phosphatase (HAD superfamily)